MSCNFGCYGNVSNTRICFLRYKQKTCSPTPSPTKVGGGLEHDNGSGSRKVIVLGTVDAGLEYPGS